MFGAKLRGSGTSGGTDDDDDDRDSGREVRVEKVAGPRKTVRWGDEAGSANNDDDDGSEAKSEDSTKGGRLGSSEMARTEKGSGGDGADISEMSRVVTKTRVAKRDLANPDVSEVETKNENENEDGVSQISRVETRKSGSETRKSGDSESARVARAETKGSSAGGGADGEKKKKKEKEKRRRKEKTRVDGRDDGAAGFLGMDLERLAVFPYF